jgi:signal transduction histidine kinase
VRVDEELMRQALLNLLLNAMQAMPTGGVVRVSVRREQRFAIVEITDNGVGIPAALLPRIFDLYFTTKPKGSGIGLAMTYRIVQLHGGTMQVRSDADPGSHQQGTTFTLQIPISIGSGTEARKVSAIGAQVAGDRTDTTNSDATKQVTTNMRKEEKV